MAGVWWIPNLTDASRYLMYYGFQEGAAPFRKSVEGPLSAWNLSYYPWHVVRHGISLPYTAILILVIALTLFPRLARTQPADRDAHEERYLWAWLVGGYIALTIAPNKGEERYALGLLPAIALIAAVRIGRLRHAWIRSILTLAIIALGVYNL